MTGRELRAQLRTQQACNSAAARAHAGDPRVAAVEQAEGLVLGAMPDHAAELRKLVGLVTAEWPQDQQAEALAAALADPTDALTCYRTLAAYLLHAPMPEPEARP